MTSALATLVGRPVHNVFRRAEIKRRQSSDGKFESSWTDISAFVKQWGQFGSAVDDVRLNRFTHEGMSLIVRNDTGRFNPEADGNSLWNGYLTRYRTLVRVQAGYYDENDSELPTETTQGIFVMTNEIPISGQTNEATIGCRSLVSIFDEVRAVEVAGLGATQSASDIVAKIRDHTDGASNFVFREFITSTAWTIQTTTSNYNLATTGSLANMTCWDLMTKVAEAEGYVVLVNRTGGVEFRNRDERSSVSAFDLFGQFFPEQNVIALEEIKEPLDRSYNYFRLKYLTADTSTSYVSAGTSTALSATNVPWKYGARIYSFENDFFNTSTAQLSVNNLYNTLAFLSSKQDVVLRCKFMPSVECLDRVDVSYHSYSLVAATLWDFFDWDNADWDAEFGENINWDAKAFKVVGKMTDLDQLTTTLRLQEL